jgi:hypothetical protein
VSENLTVADVLERAADLIEPEGAWIQRNYYSRQDGKWCHGWRDADCFCLVGALTAAARVHTPSTVEKGPIADTIKSVLPVESLRDDKGREGIFVWNDAPERTQAEVVSKLREAAAKARGLERTS